MFAFFKVGGFGGCGPESTRREPSAKPLLRRLIGDRSGNVAMMFAMIGIPLSGAVGLAVDMARVYHVNLATQSALDSSALAAGRVAQVEKSETLSKAFKSASAYFDQAKPSDVVVSTIEFSPNDQQTEFKVTATSWVRTPFLGVLNIFNYRGSQDDAPSACKGNFYGCVKLVTSATAEICLNCSDTGSGNSDEGTNLEISMMLDITGSMKGTPLTDMKAAAKDLIDIVIWNDQSKYTSRVAIAPFSAAVNLGTYFTAITGKSDDPDPDGDGYDYPSSCYNKSGKLKNSCDGNSTYKVKRYAPCVYERKGTEAATDKAPTDSSTWLVPTTVTTNTNPTCAPASAIVPLTTDRAKLKGAIDNFAASGSTAGHLGTAMAWYLISPNWKDVWPLESRPTPYGTAKVSKIAVLMTDGEYNSIYGVQDSGNVTNAFNQAKATCASMKAKSITVYTVGFNLDTTASKNMLKACATSDSHYYDTSGGEALKAAFRDIALKISKLRLTH